LGLFRYPIVSVGVGLHVTGVPMIYGKPDNGTNNNEGYYLDTAEEFFVGPQERERKDDLWEKAFEVPGPSYEQGN
jgi:hypothetical protein